MKKVFFSFLIVLLSGIIGCQEATVKEIEISLNAKSNSNTSGEVSFTEKDGVVSMEAQQGDTGILLLSNMEHGKKNLVFTEVISGILKQMTMVTA